MATYLELKEKSEDLMRQAEAARKAEISVVLADIKAKMATYGIDAVHQHAAREGGSQHGGDRRLVCTHLYRTAPQGEN